MRTPTVIVSIAIHAGFALFLFGAANKRVAARKSIAVSVADEKKPDKPKPAPPKPMAKPARRVASVPKETARSVAVAPRAEARAVPVAMPIQLSNADLTPGGIALPGTPKAAAAPRQVAGIGPEPRRKREHEPGTGPESEGPCTEEPSKPEPVFKTEIEYTASARADGIEGKLKLRLVVGKDGSVVDVEVLAGVSPELDAAAVEAAKKWRFRPAMACGKPADGGTYILARRFELGD